MLTAGTAYLKAGDFVIEKNRAKRAALEYCAGNGLSVEMLKECACSYNESMHVLAFPQKETDGLLNDLETQGHIVLIVNEDYTVSETEYTRTYFGV